MASSPCFQFYPEEFVGSGTVGTANADEVCAYTMLLCLDWTETGFGFDEERLARFCKLPRARFRKAWGHLASKFPERGGRHYNPRLEKERAKQAAWKERAAKGAAVTNAKRHASDPPSDPQATACDSLNGRILLPLPFPSPVTDTTTPLPATRKKRESRGKGEGAKPPVATWITPFEVAWERHCGRGSFEVGPALRHIGALRAAGNTDDEIIRRLDWYFENKGSESVLDPKRMAERYFLPSVAHFRKRFSKFDPSGDSETAA